MVSVEDTMKTFMECLNMSVRGLSDDEKKKVQEIFKKSAIDLCYAIVPEVDTYVSDRGIFQAATKEKELVMRAFFNEQRKAFFALANGMMLLKSHLDRMESERDELSSSMKKAMDDMQHRINSVVRFGNTALINRPNTHGTKVGT